MYRFKFRHPRGRPPSWLAEERRFNADANRLAAAIAADWIGKRARGRPSARTIKLHDEAADHAIELLAAWSPDLKPNKNAVVELLRRGRTTWPKGANTAFEF